MKNRLTEKEQDIFNDYAMTDKPKEQVAKEFGISMIYLDSIISRGDEDLKEVDWIPDFT